MAISGASPTALPQTPATAGVTTANTTPTQATGSPSPFQTLLAAAGGTAPPSAATATTPTTAADTLANDLADNNTNNTTDTTTDTNLTGLLAVAAQVLGLPANAAVAQATGQVATDVAAQSQPTTDEATRNRADQLRLGRAGGFPSAGVFLNRPIPNPATANATNALTQPTTAENTTATTQTTTTATTTIAVPALAPTSIATQTAVAAHGGTSNIPAQAPIVTNLIPNAPVPLGLSVTNPPVDAPAAPTPAAALPAAQLGDRSATTGDRFAALAEAGAQLAPAPPSSVIFANTLGQELTGQGVPTLGAAGTVLAAGTLSTQPSAGTGDTVLPLVNLNSQATAAVVLPPLPMQRTPEARPTEARTEDKDSTSAAAAANPQAPLPAFDQIATAAATPATPAVQVADAVVSHAHVLERDGGVEFHMRLDPPNLGRVDVQLVTRGDEVHGQVLCANDAVRQMIESQLPELRQRLEAAGVNVQQFSVATDPNTGGNQNAYRSAAMLEELAPRTGPANAASAPRARIGRPDTGSLDVTV